MNPFEGAINNMIKKRIGDPEQILTQLAERNPNVRKAMEITRGKTTEERIRYAANMAKQRGTTVDNIIKQMGF